MTTLRSAVFNSITVQPNNPAAFPGYGVKQFGTDLNAAWASIPRADNVYANQNNEWVVTIPPGTYTPASNDLSVIGTTVTGIAEIIDFGCTNPNLIGRVVTGPGVAPGTTITRIYPKLGTFFGAGVTYTAGSDVVTVPTTAALWVGQQVFSGGGAAALPYCAILAILGPTTIQVSINALVTTGAVSMTASGAPVAVLSAAATASNTAVNFAVNLPLQIVGTTSVGLNTVSAVSYVCNQMIGQIVTGPGVPVGTTVTAISYSATTNQGTLTLSAVATASATVTLEFQIPSVFFCDMQRRKIVNNCLGPVELGLMATGLPTQVPQPQFLTPTPGADHFIDLHLQLGWTATIYGSRQGFAFNGSGVSTDDDSSDAESTHFAYLTESRLSGTIELIDPMFGSSPNQQIVLSGLEVFGNPGRYMRSQRICSTTIALTLVTLVVGDTTCLYPGQLVSGPGIPAGAFITTIPSGTTFNLSVAATATQPSPGVSLLFNPGQLTGSTLAGCATVINTTTLTLPGVNPTTGLYVGQVLTGTGIPTNTCIAAILSATTVQMSQAATATGGAVAVTFAPAVFAFDSSMLSATTTNFCAFYSSRFRGTYYGLKTELGFVNNVEFTTFVVSTQYSHLQNVAFKGGWLWFTNSNNFDVPGLFFCAFGNIGGTPGGGFTGAAAAPLRLDASSNWSFKTNTCTLLNSTRVSLVSNPTSGVVAKTAAYTATYGEVVLADTAAGGFTVTLPTAVAALGLPITIKKISADANTLTIATTAAQTIDGVTTQAWSSQYASLTVVSDGANWEVLNSKTPNAVTKVAAYAAKLGELVLCSTAGGGFSITLPTAIGANGQQIIVKKTSADTNTLTMATSLAQTIDGAVTQTWTTQYTSVTVESDGANWFIVAKSSAFPSKVSLTGQVATIPTTTILTPNADGVFQISVYTSCTAAGAGGTATPSVGWTDDTTAQTLALPALPLTVLGGFVQQTVFVKAKAGTNITYGDVVAGVVGAPTFAIYVTVSPVT